MARKNYSMDHHRQAWEIYFSMRTYQAVSDEMGVDYSTITRWAAEDYKCRHPGCQWHGWERLLSEQEAAVAARLQLYEDGNLNPVAHDDAIRRAISPESEPQVGLTVEENRQRMVEIERRKRVLETLVRSDFERLAHWEYVWSKVFYQVSGQVLDHKALVNADGLPLSDEQVKELFGKGLKLTSLESAVRAMSVIQDQVDKLKEKIGLHKKMTNDDIGTEGEMSESTTPDLTIEDMRLFRDMLENTPPEKRDLLMRMFKADQMVLQGVPDGQGTTRISTATQPENSVPLPPIG